MRLAAWLAPAMTRLRRLTAPLACAALLLQGADIRAQQTGDSLTATAGVMLTHAETRRDSGADGSDTSVHLRPGLQWASRSGRLRGALSYGADVRQRLAGNGGTAFAAGTGDNDVQHSLNAAATLAMLEDRVFVDASAVASRRALSAFGQQVAPSSAGDNPNDEDTFQVTVRPSVRGVLGGVASYDVSAWRTIARTSHSDLGDSNQSGLAASLGSATPGLFGWGLNVSRQESQFVGGRPTVNDRVVASAIYRPDIDWQFTLRGGQERANVADVDRRSYDNWGAGLRWQPGPRTLLAVDADRRYFGDGWFVVAEHRLSQSAFRLTAVRDVTNGGTGVGQATTLYALLMSMYQSLIPDEGQRDAYVRNLLRAQGLTGAETVPGTAISTAASVQRRTDVAWTYSGQRLLVALQVYRSDTSIVDRTAPQPDGGPVSQHGLLATASWRLSPTAGLNLALSQQKTESNTVQAGNTLRMLNVGLSEQFGARTGAAVDLRFSRQSGGPDPYDEVAVSASLNHRF